MEQTEDALKGARGQQGAPHNQLRSTQRGVGAAGPGNNRMSLWGRAAGLGGKQRRQEVAD